MIDAAIAENKRWEWTSYMVLVAHAVIGLVGFGYGVCYNHQWATVGGGLVTLGLGGTLYATLSAWRASILLRMLELSLNDPREVRATLAVLREAFVSHYRKGLRKGGGE
ncbi:MAG: hypothetical protein C0501_15915 [Isosphaera sp.]|nr:hypothetical protein [Isosphaera sp.]